MERRVKRNCTYGGKLLLKGDTVYISEPFNFGKQKVFDKDRNLIFFDEIDSNDFEFVPTEDKKAPDNKEKIDLIFVGIETMMFSAFLQGKENGQFKNWYERNGMKESFKRTLEEYLKLKK